MTKTLAFSRIRGYTSLINVSKSELFREIYINFRIMRDCFIRFNTKCIISSFLKIMRSRVALGKFQVFPSGHGFNSWSYCITIILIDISIFISYSYINVIVCWAFVWILNSFNAYFHRFSGIKLGIKII